MNMMTAAEEAICDLKFLLRQYKMTPSQAFSHVIVEMVPDISETVPVCNIRG
jgi:hypothetical protein